MNDDQSKPILVLGGTGHYGRHIVQNLLGKGLSVRVLSRGIEKARKILGEGPEVVEGDITARESIIEVVTGVRAVIISISAFTPRSIRRFELIERDSVLSVFAEAEKAGISRMVYISAYDTKQDVSEYMQREIGLGIAKIKPEVERALANTNLNWTVLGAPPSMEIFFAMIRGNTMMVPGGGPPALPTVSPVDVGEIAAQTVLRNDLRGMRFRMTGPDAISFPDAAKRISAVFGKTIKFRKIPLLLPKIARVITRPFAPVNDMILFINQALGFIQLLNQFPQDIVAEVPQAHRLLLDTFDYAPTTLEMEARRRSRVQQ